MLAFCTSCWSLWQLSEWDYKWFFFCFCHFLLDDSTASWVLLVLALYFQRLLNIDSCIKKAQRFRHPWDVSQCSGRWYCLASSGQGVKAWNFHCIRPHLLGRPEDYEAAKHWSSSAFLRLQGELELQLTSLLVNPGSLNEPQRSSLPIPWARSHTAHNTLLCMCESTPVRVEGGKKQSHSSVSFGEALVTASL